MGFVYVHRQIRALIVGTPLLLSLSLGGCATSTAGSSLMDARAEVPTPSSYLPVEVLPAPRENRAMTPDEQSKLKKELTAARDRHPPDAKARTHPAIVPTQPARP
jgi:hypothetical protein